MVLYRLLPWLYNLHLQMILYLLQFYPNLICSHSIRNIRNFIKVLKMCCVDGLLLRLICRRGVNFIGGKTLFNIIGYEQPHLIIHYKSDTIHLRRDYAQPIYRIFCLYRRTPVCHGALR